MSRRILAALCTLVLLGANAPQLTVYSAPAAKRPAGAPNPRRPFDLILPNGRTVAPVGASTVVGTNALGLTLTPDGAFAIVSNDDELRYGVRSYLARAARGGYSLAVVNARTMRLVSTYQAPKRTFFAGVVACKDPADPSRTIVLASGGPSNGVDVFDLSRYGRLTFERAIAIPGPADARFANDGHSFPASLALSDDHRTAYAVNFLGDTVTAIDVKTRTVESTVPVGFFPSGIAVAHARLYVTDGGLMRYARLPQRTLLPPFANVPRAPRHASALSLLGLDARGNVHGGLAPLRMDRTPDGVENVGGADPSAIVLSRNGRYAYVTMTNVDRVAIVDLRARRVIGGLDLRLFDEAPYGTQPDAIVRSPDGTRVYVALAGMNAVAVLDSRNPAKLHRLGLIPTGWYPSALAVSKDGRYLYVANAKGLGTEPGPAGESDTMWATLQRIDLKSVPLVKTTLSTLRYLRVARLAVSDPIVPPLRSLQRSSVIRHVVFILEGSQTFDSALGDLQDAQGHPYANGDPALASWPQSLTPNLHALASEFALAENVYTGGTATAFEERTERLKDASGAFFGSAEDPEDYPRSGYIFNALQRAHLTYRDYGELLRVSGYETGGAATPGLGGYYTWNVPALAALAGHVDLRYPGWNPRIGNLKRALEFERDYGRYVKAGTVPDFTYVWLPGDHGESAPGLPSRRAQAAENDRAVGEIVQYISHLSSWASTAIFIMPADTRGGRDHVYARRTYAIVVSPYAKRHYIGADHLSTASILKTEEEILGLPALSLNDLLATDMADFFTPMADLTPFEVLGAPTSNSSHTDTTR